MKPSSTTLLPSSILLRSLYTRMLLTRLVDDGAWKLHEQGQIDFVASCRGHEAAQVGSAMCIEVGKDFTLPYYRDLGVVLTIGMSPYEVFRTYLYHHPEQTLLHWGYHKHNTVTGPAPVATQILHAAGIAFACQLRKAPVVTVAYCGNGTITEPDFREGVRFAALHRLPAVFICEQDCTNADIPLSCTQEIALPTGLTHFHIDGTDILTVYTTMQAAMQHARTGQGPVLLEMSVTRSISAPLAQHDPLVRCQQWLQEQGLWDDEWAAQLYTRLSAEVERAMYDALRDTQKNEA